jgi:hypothetical protein
MDFEMYPACKALVKPLRQCWGRQQVLQFLVIIIIIKIRVRTVKFQIYEWQRAIISDAFASYIYKTRSASPSHLHGFWMKRTTGSGALSFVYLKFYGSHSYF